MRVWGSGPDKTNLSSSPSSVSLIALWPFSVCAFHQREARTKSIVFTRQRIYSHAGMHASFLEQFATPAPRVSLNRFGTFRMCLAILDEALPLRKSIFLGLLTRLPDALVLLAPSPSMLPTH